MIQNDLQNLAHPITELQLLPGNPRRGDIDGVKRSLEAFGQRKPIVVRRSDSVVIAGNHTLQAAQALGWDEIAVVWVDDDEVTSKAFALADNRTAELGDYDEEALADLINDVGSLNPGLLESSGWDDKAVKELLDRVEQIELPTDVDEVPEDVPAVSKLGDVWLLGNHRVMCGDSTEETQVEKLMNKNKPDLLFTDPPYGVDYVAMRGGKKIANDSNLQIAEEVMIKALSNAKTDTAFVCCNWRSLTATIDAMIESGFEPKACIVWDKESRVQNLDKYAKQHEFILYAGKYGGQKTVDVDVWRIGRDFKPDHPTPKPVELVTRALMTSSISGSNVLDLFGGSGSTLIAAQESNRTAYLMELDPKYVDVICARYQKVTGVLPVLESSGKVHDFLNA